MRQYDRSIEYIDTHTEGEPTRIVIAGCPFGDELPPRDLVKRLSQQADWFRSRVAEEPRGHEAMVGAVLCEPADPNCEAGVVFFNNCGYLGMCGHGAIGVAIALEYMGRIRPGIHQLETPVGSITINLHSDSQVEIKNVPSYRYQNDVRVDVDGIGEICGDIAWGGNWFFLTQSPRYQLITENLARLTDDALRIRTALESQGITGEGGALIDHVEFFGPTQTAGAHSRNFVLCPGGAYDRSPCGTGTSAKLACLAADGRWAAGQDWIQESIIGSQFVASYELVDERASVHANAIVPTIRGRAFVCNEGRIVVQNGDPFAHGLFSKPTVLGDVG
ncbi:proline racemase family protein [Roseiconus lacunae]|uniref:proline racemase family protein n=1 Tax=Roseiconus lacunae TaxID=2605694 RepID=UPI001E5B0313|nr:proline racemase family protein [Roseiconus lacunae]MCD0460207.1 proline racemase family protein [Roseiconus lacunae]WRQ53606.1 proline racemase family protein [Stieleria sp. HD01]